MKYRLIDNHCGLFTHETSAFQIMRNAVANAAKKSTPTDFFIIANFNFFDAFKKLLPEIDKLNNNGKLGKMRILICSEESITPKNFLFDLRNDAVSLEKSDSIIMKKLYREKKLYFRINYKDKIKTLLYITENDGKYKVFCGNTSLTSEKEGEAHISLLTEVSGKSQIKQKKYMLFFKKLWMISDTHINNIRIIRYLNAYAELEVMHLPLRRFISSFLKKNKKEYLVKNISRNDSAIIEFQNNAFYACVERMENYGSVLLSNSIGISENRLTARVIKFYYLRNRNILIIASEERILTWEKLLKEEDLFRDGITFLDRKKLQAPDFDDSQFVENDFIIVDEAEYFSTAKDINNRRKHFMKILNQNPEAKLMMISKNIINDSLLDFVYIVNTFIRGSYKNILEEIGVTEKLSKLENEILTKTVNNDSIDIIQNILDLFLVQQELKNFDFNSAKLYEPGQEANRPQIITVKYAYSHEIFNVIFENLLPTIMNLNFEYTKLKFVKYCDEPSLIRWYKWLMLRKIDSSLFAFIATCENFRAKTQFLSGLLRGNKENMEEGLKYFTSYQIDNIVKAFNDTAPKEKSEILERLEADFFTTTKLLDNINGIKYLGNKDEKITALLKIINSENKPTLIFSESDDTLKYLQKRLLEYRSKKIEVILGENISYDGEDIIKAENLDIHKICQDFESGDIEILLMNDNVPEEIKLQRAKVIINFDLPNIPFVLSKRINKTTTDPKVNKIKVYNFQSDKRVDKEIELFEKMNLDVSDIISYFGVDYVQWCRNVKSISDISNDNIQTLLLMTKEYKDFLTKKNIDDVTYKVPQKLPHDDISLRQFIKYLDISEETLKLTENKFKKPIYTILKAEEESFYVIYLTSRGLKTYNNIYFSETEVNREITTEEENKITDIIKNEIKSEADFIEVIGIIIYTKNV